MNSTKTNPNRKPRLSLRSKRSKKHGVGIVKGNPQICIACEKPIGETDLWTLYTSPRDPQYGAYSVIKHQRCDGAAD